MSEEYEDMAIAHDIFTQEEIDEILDFEEENEIDLDDLFADDIDYDL